ncbi:hypothetical protein Tco_0939144 [Tanacetum coccineum]|uniref:Retrovirus-related Pol polyprotein from transposon TNT 1-94 n=1 Tax=Tanacetum coccineum TaxID=301880 RepID=A0ABQ5DR38_9ASTR
MSMLVQKSQDHKMERLQDDDKRLGLVDDLKKFKITFISTQRYKSKPKVNDHYINSQDIGIEQIAFTKANHTGFQDTRRSTSRSAQFLDEKIPLYYDSKRAISLSCNSVQHSRTKHIVLQYHFIKEHVENGTVELYFVKTAYQLEDIFTKVLGIERFKFLINHLAMQSITPE